MKYVKLGDICNIKTGKLDANASSSNGKYPFFTCSKEPLKIETYSYDCECVLVAGNGDLNVKYYNGKFDAYQRTYIIEVFDKNLYNTKYIYLLIDSKIEELRTASIGGVIKYIKIANLSEMKIPVISMDDQNQIIKKMFNMKKIIDTKKHQIIKLNDLIKSQFVEMFDNKEFPYVNFKEYMERCVDIGSNGANAVVMEHYNMTDEKDYAMVIRFTNLNSGDFEKNVKYFNKKDYEFFSKSKVYGDEIIFCKIGSAGMNYIMPKLDMPVTLGLNQIMVTPKDINTRYLYEYINSYEGKKYINNNINGAVTKTITKHALWEFPIKTPPIELQNKFSQIVEQIDKQKFEFENSLRKLEELQSSLMQEYFG